MRLAEFRMRLFVFFAGRLLKWAGATEEAAGDELSPAATAAAGGGVTRTAEPEAENSMAPPDHWARLITKAPPQAWLDLIRERAPQLLSAPEEEPVSAEGEMSLLPDSEELTSAAAEDAAELQPPSVQRSPGVFPVAPENPTNYFSAADGRSWLNRLRFSAPQSRSNKAETAYARAERYREAAANYLAAREDKPGKRSDLTLNANVRRETPAGSPPVVRDEETAPLRQPARPSYVESRRSLTREDGAAEARDDDRKRWFTSIDGLTNGERPNSLEDADLSALSPAPLAAPFYPETTQSRISDQSGDKTPHSREAREIRPSPIRLPQTSSPRSTKTEEPILKDSVRQRTSYPPPQPTRSTRHSYTAQSTTVFSDSFESLSAAGSVSDGRGAFVSMSSEVERETGPGNNLWPDLPPAPTFEIADELQTRESESEGLRRLEREQRGVLWNA